MTTTTRRVRRTDSEAVCASSAWETHTGIEYDDDDTDNEMAAAGGTDTAGASGVAGGKPRAARKANGGKRRRRAVASAANAAWRRMHDQLGDEADAAQVEARGQQLLAEQGQRRAGGRTRRAVAGGGQADPMLPLGDRAYEPK